MTILFFDFLHKELVEQFEDRMPRSSVRLLLGDGSLPSNGSRKAQAFYQKRDKPPPNNGTSFDGVDVRGILNIKKKRGGREHLRERTAPSRRTLTCNFRARFGIEHPENSMESHGRLPLFKYARDKSPTPTPLYFRTMSVLYRAPDD